jgi:hypothetical protein
MISLLLPIVNSFKCEICGFKNMQIAQQAPGSNIHCHLPGLVLQSNIEITLISCEFTIIPEAGLK